MATTVDIAIALDGSSSILSYHKEIHSSLLTKLELLLHLFPNHVRLGLSIFRSDTDPIPTTTYGFTSSPHEFKRWINDIPMVEGDANDSKAVANALTDVLAMNWGSENDFSCHKKMVILITDGPPCGLFNDQCRCQNEDLWRLSNRFDEENITIVVAGVGSGVNIADDFYCALARKTGGEYLPLVNASRILPKLIQRAIISEQTFRQLFLRLDINFDIELGSEYRFSVIKDRVDFIMRHCRTMSDIRRELNGYCVGKDNSSGIGNEATFSLPPPSPGVNIPVQTPPPFDLSPYSIDGGYRTASFSSWFSNRHNSATSFYQWHFDGSSGHGEDYDDGVFV